MTAPTPQGPQETHNEYVLRVWGHLNNPVVPAAVVPVEDAGEAHEPEPVESEEDRIWRAVQDAGR